MNDIDPAADSSSLTDDASFEFATSELELESAHESEFHRPDERMGPAFSEQGYLQGRHIPGADYGPRGFAGRDGGREDSSIKYDDQWHSGPHGGYRSIYSGMGEGRASLGKGPKNYTRSDERIREEVCECLSSGHLDASDIEVSVQDGEVQLSGTVVDRRSKRLAEDLLERVAGIRDIANRLKVKRMDDGAERSKKSVIKTADETSNEVFAATKKRPSAQA